jgi:uncharacterized protein (TIGR02679 family)
VTDPDLAPQPEGGAADLAARARQLAARPGYGVLLAALRERLERGGQPATVTLPDLDADARRALADLLGRRRPPTATAAVRLAALEEGLRASRVAAGLVEVLEALGGPLADRRADRADEQVAWNAVWELEHAATARPEVAAWLAGLRRHGILRRLVSDPVEAGVLLDRALTVVERLPARGVALSVLAGEVVGDPHALDHGQPLATLVLRAAARMSERDVPASARGRRQLWAEVGVVCDPLSVSVLVLGLRLAGSDIVANACDDHAGFGVPLRLTLHQLATTDTLRSAQERVLVCENPAVVAAATARLSERDRPWDGEPAPLVCVEGVPDVAADRLLNGLAEGGSTLAFHADFDWGGLRIGTLLHARYGAAPWRFGAAEYRAAVDRVAVGGTLRGRAAAAPWDPDLAPAMRAAGVTVAEEQVLDDLLPDVLPDPA